MTPHEEGCPIRWRGDAGQHPVDNWLAVDCDVAMDREKSGFRLSSCLVKLKRRASPRARTVRIGGYFLIRLSRPKQWHLNGLPDVDSYPIRSMRSNRRSPLTIGSPRLKEEREPP